MTARFKDFGRGNDKNVSDQPLTFKLFDEDFHCYPRMQGKALLEFVEMANSENASDTAKVTRVFFKKVLKADSYEKFDALLDDPEKIVSVETLAEITGWLLEQYGDRPESQPEV
jgi:hypothetical protein